MALLLYPGQNIIRKKLNCIDTNEKLASLAFLQPVGCVHIPGSGHSQAQWGATQIFPKCTEWKSTMVLEDKQRQLVLSCIAQAQLSSPRHAQIMFEHLVKGKWSLSATKCKPGQGGKKGLSGHWPVLPQARSDSATGRAFCASEDTSQNSRQCIWCKSPKVCTAFWFCEQTKL